MPEWMNNFCNTIYALLLLLKRVDIVLTCHSYRHMTPQGLVADRSKIPSSRPPLVSLDAAKKMSELPVPDVHLDKVSGQESIFPNHLENVVRNESIHLAESNEKNVSQQNSKLLEELENAQQLVASLFGDVQQNAQQISALQMQPDICSQIEQIQKLHHPNDEMRARLEL